MNKLILATAVSFALSTSAALAVDEQHPDQMDAPAKDAGMPMGKMQDNMLKMQNNMLKMHEQMHKIMQAKDPKERERLKQEHLKMMQENMKMMGGGKGGKSGSCMMGGEGKGGAMDAPTSK